MEKINHDMSYTMNFELNRAPIPHPEPVISVILDIDIQISLLFSAHQIRKSRPTPPFGKNPTDKFGQFLVPRQKT